MKKGKWNAKWNKKSWALFSRLLLPVFCAMLLFGGCSSEELANVDWEAVESELAALEEEMPVLEEGAYTEQQGAFGEGEESALIGDDGSEEAESTSETSEKQDPENIKSTSESSKEQDAQEVKNIFESSEKEDTGDAASYEKSYEVVKEPEESNEHLNSPIDEDGSYTTVEDVSLYLYIYEELPDNFMTKEEARELGWEGGSLEPYAPGMCIGGDYFGNYEGLLPKEKGRDYYECDIDTLGAKSRGAKRIVYSDDGLIYYTDDHYESFTLLYGEE